jgi:hypothetical protein
MKVYVIASDKYAHICPLTIYFLNKNWPEQDVVIVGYEGLKELKKLPSNVSVVSLGKQDDFGTSWTDGLIPFFEKIPDEYFTLILDDHILLNRVDEKKIKIIEEQFLLKRVDKATIGGGISLSNAIDWGENLLLFNQGINYRTSLHPAVWTKEYFIKYLKPNMTSWEFEAKNNSEAMFDNAKIVSFSYDYPLEPHIYSYLELYTKGSLNITKEGNLLNYQPSNRFFDKEDIKYIWHYIHQPDAMQESEVLK